MPECGTRRTSLPTLQDWERHKKDCKSGKGHVSIDTAQEPGAAFPVSSGLDATGFLGQVSDGRERSVELQMPGVLGGKVLLSSRTMTASGLKQLRDSGAESIAQYDRMFERMV